MVIRKDDFPLCEKKKVATSNLFKINKPGPYLNRQLNG